MIALSASPHQGPKQTPARRGSADVVVVVPCYNEEKRLDLPSFERFLRSAPHVTLLFVDDGSCDGSLMRLNALRAANPEQAQILHLERNQGKAEAVRQGSLRALAQKPRYIGYWDADLATPLDVILSLEDVLEAHIEKEAVFGARVALLGHEIERKPLRHYLGRVFATAASIALNIPVYDTQCGAKLFRATERTKDLFDEPFGSRWVFDVELIARYLVSGGTIGGLYEYAVPSWRDVAESKVKPLDFLRAIGEVARIYQRYPLGQPLRPLFLPLTSMFSQYVLVGALGTGIHYALLVLAVEGFGAPAAKAATVGAVSGAAINYFFNYHFTFTSGAQHARALAKFAIVASLGAALSGYGVQAGTSLGLHYVVAQLACTMAFLVLGFLLNKVWTFRTPAPPLNVPPAGVPQEAPYENQFK